jgi:anti-sigma B factor antagonist
VTVIRVAGELELGQADALLAPLRHAVEADDGPVVLDLSGVTFIDSTGLRALLDAHARLERLVVAAPPGSPVETLLSLTGLDDVLTVRPDVDAALADAA